jgi:hypothetical protein
MHKRNLSTSIALVLCTLRLLVSGPANAAVIENFESYTLPYDVVNDGSWTDSSSPSGAVVTTSNSGEYIGGQGLQNENESGGFIGGVVDAAFNQTSWSFDFRSFGTGRVTMFGWVDDASDGFDDNSEAQFQMGNVDNIFGFRGASFGSDFESGVAVDGDKWYRVTTSVLNEGTGEVSMTVRNLTDAVDVDLNGASAGIDYTVTLGAAFGSAISSYDGYGLRLDNSSIGDNVTVIPEPSTLILFLGAFAAFFIKLRRR